MSTNTIVSPTADQPHTATLRQPRRAVPATEPESRDELRVNVETDREPAGWVPAAPEPLSGEDEARLTRLAREIRAGMAQPAIRRDDALMKPGSGRLTAFAWNGVTVSLTVAVDDPRTDTDILAAGAELYPVDGWARVPCPDWCIADWHEPTEHVEDRSHFGGDWDVDLSLESPVDLLSPEERAQWEAEAAAAGQVLPSEPERGLVHMYLHQHYRTDPEPRIWLGREDTTQGAHLTLAEAEQVARNLLAMVEAARKGAGR